MVAVHHVRPAAVVYFDGVYSTLGADDYRSREIEPSELPALQSTWPVWLSLQQPENAAEREAVILTWQLMGGAAFETSLYQKYEQGIAQLQSEGYSVNEAREQGISVPDDAPATARVFTITARYGSFPVLVDTADGRLLALLTQQSAPTHRTR
jgi:hypothetical protein